MNGSSHNGVLRPRGILTGRLLASILAVAIVLVFSVIIGYLTSHNDPRTFVALILLAVATWSVLKWPDWGLVLLLSLTSTIVAPEVFASIVNPNDIYYALEVLIILITVGSIFKWPQEKTGSGVFHWLSSSPQSIAMTTFLAIVLIKAAVVLIDKRLGGGSVSQMYTFNRGLTFYLLFFPVMLLMNSRHRQRWLVGVLFVMGSLVMIRILAELFFQDLSVFKLIAVAQPLSDETPTVDQTVLRLRAPGGTIVLACFWIGLMNIILRSWNWRHLALYVPLTLVMLTGILLEFNRSYVIPMMVLVLLALFLNKSMVRVKMLTLMAVILLALVVVFSATGQLDKYVDAALIRYGSAFSSQALESQSVVSREIEQSYAWDAINRSPVLGIGLDELYRPPIPGMLDNLRWYIHNTYIWLWTYFGIIGLAAFLGVIATALLRSIFNWKKIGDPLLQATVLGFAFSIATLLAANFAAPKFYDIAAVPVVAVMLGLIEAIIITARRQNNAE